MGDVVNELGVTVDEVNQYLSYILSTDKDEPVVNKNSKEFACIIDRTLKGQDLLLLISGAMYRRKVKYIKLTLEQKDEQIKRVFNSSSKYIYSIACDIVKNKYKNSWSDFINSMVNNILWNDKSNPRKRLKDFGDYCLKNKDYLSPDGIKNLMNGNFGDGDSVLEIKAELIRMCMHTEIPNAKDASLKSMITRSI